MDEVRSLLGTIVGVGLALVIAGWILSKVGEVARRRYLEKHGPDSLPPLRPPIWESVPKRDWMRLAAVLGGFLVVGITARCLN